MTTDSVFQCYQAYLNPHEFWNTRDKSELPWFITSDALFHAYAVSLQKGLAAMERTHADQLRDFVTTMLQKLEKPRKPSIEGDSALITEATLRAKFLIGVAARLMEVKDKITPADLDREIEEEAARIRTAQGFGLIPRLGMKRVNSATLDYTQFKAAGFYAPEPALARYFQTVRWLQLAPFRIDDETSMLAAAILSGIHLAGVQSGVPAEAAIHRSFHKRDERLCALAGPASRPLIFDCMSGFANSTANDTAGMIRHARAHLTKVADQLATHHITSTAEPRGSLAAYGATSSRLADATLIEALSRQHGETYVPDTLSIPSWLGSRFAHAELAAQPAVASLINEADELLSPTQADTFLHTASLQTLQKLLATPAPNAPAFMKSRAWQAKSCQTALAAWAQMRHLWVLQARPQGSVGAAFQEWPAYVEPAPHFFSALAALCKQADQLFSFPEGRQAFEKRLAAQIREMAGRLAAEPATEDQEQQIATLELLIAADFDWNYSDEKGSRIRARRLLNQCADWIENGQADEKHPAAQKMLDRLLVEETPPFLSLADTCSRLALIATRQMRGEEPGKDDAKWLIHFGLELAFLTGCTFYDSPDNVPKCARIFANEKLGKTLHAGLGRPHFLYVLYPWKGAEVLCRGAVLPYLESHRSGTITDDEWRQSLGTPDQLMQAPKWIKALTAD